MLVRVRPSYVRGPGVSLLSLGTWKKGSIEEKLKARFNN